MKQTQNLWLIANLDFLWVIILNMVNELPDHLYAAMAAPDHQEYYFMISMEMDSYFPDRDLQRKIPAVMDHW